MDKELLFCCNANSESGLGHFSRSLNLARAIISEDPSLKIKFIGDFNPFAEKVLLTHEISLIKHENLFLEIGAIEANVTRKTFLFLDSYEITQEWLNQACRLTERVLMLDDFNVLDYEKVLLLINFRACSSGFSYNAKNVRLGLGYTPLKKELAEVRTLNKKKTTNKIRSIMVFIGGTDRHEVGVKALNTLDSAFNGVELIYIGSLDLDNDLSGKNKITVRPRVENIEALYQQVDIAVTGGGFSRYEAAYCAIPSVTISQTKEQEEDIRIFVEKGMTLNAGFAENFQDNLLLEKIKQFQQGDEISKFRNACFSNFPSSPTSAASESVIEVLARN